MPYLNCQKTKEKLFLPAGLAEYGVVSVVTLNVANFVKNLIFYSWFSKAFKLNTSNYL